MEISQIILVVNSYRDWPAFLEEFAIKESFSFRLLPRHRKRNVVTPNLAQAALLWLCQFGFWFH